MGSEMESETLDAMNYIKIISKEKKTVNRIMLVNLLESA